MSLIEIEIHVTQNQGTLYNKKITRIDFAQVELGMPISVYINSSGQACVRLIRMIKEGHVIIGIGFPSGKSDFSERQKWILSVIWELSAHSC